MTRKLVPFLFLILFYQSTFATHNRAGEIVYTWIGGFTYRVTIITYTKESSTNADRDTLHIFWGDQTSETLPRVNGPIVNGFPNGESFGNNLDIKMNKYSGVHTYPGYGSYLVSMEDPNRIQDIRNINNGNSVNEPFYIEDTLIIPDPQSLLGHDNSPILLNPPIDFAFVNQKFVHNPNAYDPDDDDSLTFEFTIPKVANGLNVTNWVSPELVAGTTGNRTFTIDHVTGEITWDSPQFVGIYNIAILVKEWRRIQGHSPALVGTMERDMEIIVDDKNNLPPVISKFRDTCVIAGTLLKLNISAADPNTGQLVTLSANGGPFEVMPPVANFDTETAVVPHSLFTWQTTCDHVRSQFYQVVFRAIDNYVIPLSDVESWRIKVIAPAPQNLAATPLGNSINLKWDNPYQCSTTKKFLGFSIWRKEGSNPFDIDTCVTGLEGRGYTKIKDDWPEYTYKDNDVQRGKDYCYRILAGFGVLNNFNQKVNFVESLPSNESCAELKKDVPVITNVSVRSTDLVNGSLDVSWSKPDGTILDTLQNPKPYQYKVYRSEDFNGGSFHLVKTITAQTFYQLTDTTFVDTLNINTVDTPLSYKIVFTANNGDSIGETTVASSVFLTIGFASHELNLSWKENVPWTNDSFTIFRKEKFIDKWDSIGVTSSHQFTDKALTNDSVYCYYIRSSGKYSSPGFVDPIINLSQRVCAAPKDTVGPCPPTLTVRNDCNDPNFSLGSFVNALSWTKPAISCGSDAIKYRIYFASTSSSELELIDSSHLVDDTTFIHNLNNTVAGCYTISAVDSYYNEGPKSNEICLDNCPKYELPNVFTPNHDGKNDVYHPILPYKYIDHVDMKIFDSWGVLVFQTTDAAINWDGTNMNNHHDSPEGTYYYVCEVYENRVEGIVKTSKPLSGFIHLYR